jgi:pyruvate formate lyase activating enzyme
MRRDYGRTSRPQTIEFESAASRITGTIFNIQFDSTEDGPGIRTTVFMKGCPMSCLWCHNPEGLSRSRQLVWYETRCIGALKCVEVCPKNALKPEPGKLCIDRALCDACGDCVSACPSAALEVFGTTYTVDELVAMALRDRVFYETSGGGVTLSGGEASLQARFCLEVMKALKQEGIHLALDTCGAANWKTLAPLVELADLVLYDLKIIDAEKHREYTGFPLDVVLENARRISSSGKPMWIRTPIVPGYTDAVENIAGIARFIHENLPAVERYDILAFNNTCAAKYERLGLTWKLEGKKLISEEFMEQLAATARNEGLDFVHWSGLTARSA